MKPLYNVKKLLLSAVSHMLTPLIKTLVRKGVSFQEFSEVAKAVYVKSCIEQSTSGVPSTARIAIMTGLSRKEVERLTDRPDDTLSWAPQRSRVALAVQGWLEGQDFVGPYGVPRVLKLGQEGEGLGTFADLIERYVPGAPLEVVLDELIRSGVAMLSVDGTQVHLIKRDLQIEGLDTGITDFYAREIRRFLDTSLLNLEAERSEKIYQRWVIADQGIGENDWGRFAQDVKQRLDPVLFDLDARFSGYEAPESTGVAGLAVGVGVYVFREPLAASRQSDSVSSG